MLSCDILLLCHDQLELQLLTTALKEAGLKVCAAGALETLSDPPRPALILFASRDHRYHITVRALRNHFATPLILLTDYHSETDHLQALQEGVDLILFRPYSFRFLAAQIPALLRRLLPPAPTETGEDKKEPSIIRLDSETQTLYLQQGPPLRLSRLEFRLLRTLMRYPRQVISTETLVEHVWGYDGDGDGEQIRKLVCRLRSKMKDSGHEPSFIHTVPNVGYSFRDVGKHHQYAGGFA